MTVRGCDPHRETFTVAVVERGGGGGDDGVVSVDTGRVRRRGRVSRRARCRACWGGGFRLERPPSRGGVGVAGFDVREVPPRRSAQWRVADHRSKTDRIDALSVARLVAADPDLGPAKVILIRRSVSWR